MTDTAVAAPAAKPEFPWWLLLVQGIVALVVGGMLMMSPARTTVFLVQIFGWFWLFQGVFALGSLFVDRTAWGWRLFSGLLSIWAGAYIIGSPYMGAAIFVGVATLILGINGIIIGVVDLMKAFKGGGWGVGFLGALSLVIGIAIAFNLVAYAAVLPWVWGLFAIISGVMAIVSSFQLKKASAA
jgi:uncharacterized membrane protein HdeD (DUF308 family)